MFNKINIFIKECNQYNQYLNKNLYIYQNIHIWTRTVHLTDIFETLETLE